MRESTFTAVETGAHEGAFGDNALPLPTEAKCRAGNYRMGRVTIGGLRIAIEQPRGTVRSGVDASGNRWQSRMAAHYGYFIGTRGADGDGVDVFVGPNPDSGVAFIINQNVGGRFDEHKVVLGALDAEHARLIYLQSYERGWRGLASMVPATIPQLTHWLRRGAKHRAVTAEQLNPNGKENMNRTHWNADATPEGMSLDALLYQIRQHDGSDNLLLDAVTVAEIVDDSEGVIALDAMVIPVNLLSRRLGVLKSIMERSGDSVKPLNVQISEPFKQRGVTMVAAVFELSDGQTVSIYFHNPDTTPNRVLPTDEFVSWKWLLNKKDVTIVVAPERGADLNPREVARRIMRLAERNSAAFARANSKRAERMTNIQTLKEEITGLEGELGRAQSELEAVKLEADEHAVSAHRAGVAAKRATSESDFFTPKEFASTDALYAARMDKWDSEGEVGGWMVMRVPGEDSVPEHYRLEASDKSVAAFRTAEDAKAWGEANTLPEEGAQEQGGPEAFEHGGHRIYPIAIKGGGDRWAVQLGADPGTGDTLWATREEAIAEAELLAKRAAQAAERAAEEQREAEAAAAAAAAFAETTLGQYLATLTPIKAGAARKALEKRVSASGKPTTIASFIEAQHADGTLAIDTEEVGKIKPMSRAAFNRADGREQAAHEKRMREAGTKTVYYVNDMDLGASAYGYAAYLLGEASRETEGEGAALPALANATPEFTSWLAERGAAAPMVEAIEATAKLEGGSVVWGADPGGAMDSADARASDFIGLDEAEVEWADDEAEAPALDSAVVLDASLVVDDSGEVKFNPKTDKWRTAKNGQKYIVRSGKVVGGMGGKFNGKKLLKAAGDVAGKVARRIVGAQDNPREGKRRIMRGLVSGAGFAIGSVVAPGVGSVLGAGIGNAIGNAVYYHDRIREKSGKGEVKLDSAAMDDATHAMVTLHVALEVAENNEPINRAEGNIEQADAEAAVAASIREALATLGAPALDSASVLAIAPVAEAVAGRRILKGVAKTDGDGWKDTRKAGDVVFVWDVVMPAPYADGQYPRVGTEGWTASVSDFSFAPADPKEVAALLDSGDAATHYADDVDLDGGAEWEAAPEDDDEEVAFDGDFAGHPFRGNQYRKGSRTSGTAVSATIHAKKMSRAGSPREVLNAHRIAHHSHVAASLAVTTGAARRYHLKMARLHGKHGGLAAALDSVELLDAVRETHATAVLRNAEGAEAGSVLIYEDGSASVRDAKGGLLCAATSDHGDAKEGVRMALAGKGKSGRKEFVDALTFLTPFLSKGQSAAIKRGAAGEESQYFVDKAVEMADLIRTMPKTYEQDGKGDEAMAYLHYFRGGADWYITEKDKSGAGVQQAFGLADLFGDGGELGYISIAELVSNGVELDLHWTPKAIGAIRGRTGDDESQSGSGIGDDLAEALAEAGWMVKTSDRAVVIAETTRDGIRIQLHAPLQGLSKHAMLHVWDENAWVVPPADIRSYPMGALSIEKMIASLENDVQTIVAAMAENTGDPDVDSGHDELIEAGVAAAKSNGIAKLATSDYFTMEFEGDDVLVDDELRGKIEEALGEKLVEAMLPGLEGQVTLVPESQHQTTATPTADPAGEAAAESIDLAADKALLQSVIDGTAPDMLSPELADQLEAAFLRHEGDAEVAGMFELAVNAYQAAMMTATASL